MSRWSFISYLLANVALSMVSLNMAQAQTYPIEINASNKNYTVAAGTYHTQTDTDIFKAIVAPQFVNNGTLTNTNGHILNLDSASGMYNVVINNTGTMSVLGTGYAVHGEYYPNQPLNTTITNTGALDRIYLLQTNGSKITNTGTINGSVLLGTNAVIENFGTMATKAGDTNANHPANLINLGKNAFLKNGADVTFDDKGVAISFEAHPTANLTTDNITFTQNGTLINSGTINNKEITAKNSDGNLLALKIVLANSPYIEANSANGILYGNPSATSNVDLILPATQGAQLITDNIKTGAQTSIHVDQGSTVHIKNLQLGDTSTANFGGDYIYQVEKKITVKNSEGEDEELSLSPVPHATNIQIDTATLGKNNTFTLNLGTTLTGNTFNMNDGGALNIKGATVTMNTTNNSLVFGTNGSITLEADSHPSLTLSNKSKVPSKAAGALLNAKHLVMGENGTLTMTVGTANIDRIQFGNGGKITNAGDQTPLINATSISFGNNGSYQSALLQTNADTMAFGTHGTISNNSSFNVSNLTMGDNATITTTGDMHSRTIVGSDSVTTIQGEGSAGISGGFFKADGASNVTITAAMTKPQAGRSEAYLKNGVNVDAIVVASEGLILSGDIRGKITLNSDTFLHLTGLDVSIHDKIVRGEGATGTQVWIDLDSDEFYNTAESIDVDTILITGGGLTVRNPITATSVMLDSSTSLRVTGDYIQADIIEKDNEAVNTTLFINPTSGQMDSFGHINLDRVIVENGTFNVWHPISASGTNQGMPEGIELGSNTTINIHNNIMTSRLIRQRGLATPVVNTTTTINGGKLTVYHSADMDTLALNAGTFEFLNNGNPATDTISIGKNLTVAQGSAFIASGTVTIGEGLLTVDKGLLSVSSKALKSADALNGKEISALNLTENLMIKDGGKIDLRTSGTTTDTINVSGQATLSGKNRLILRGAQKATPYQILSAAGGLSVPENPFSLSFLWEGTSTVSDGNNLTVSIGTVKTLKQGLSGTQASENDLKMAELIDTMAANLKEGESGGFLDDMLYADNADSALTVLSQYKPEGYMNAPLASLRTATAFQNVLSGAFSDINRFKGTPSSNNRISATPYQRNNYYQTTRYGRSGGDVHAYSPYASQTYYKRQISTGTPRTQSTFRTDKGGMWAKPFALSATQDNAQGIMGYDYTAYGVTAGIDKTIGAWSLGISGLYAVGDLEQTDSTITADTDTWGIGLYANYRHNTPYFFNLFANYMSNTNTATHRVISAGAVAKADYDTSALTAGAAWGYDISLAEVLYVTPKIGVTYTRLSSDDIMEKGNTPLLMTVKNGTINSIQTPVELKVAVPVTTRTFEVIPEAHVRYTHDFGDTDYQSDVLIQGTNTTLKMDNVGMPENIITVGGSVSWTSGAHELSGSYDYDTSSGLSAHTLTLGYKYLF